MYPLHTNIYIPKKHSVIIMKCYKDNTATASRNVRYRKTNTSSVPSYIVCEICGMKMYIDRYGTYKCPKCDIDTTISNNDSQIF